MSEQKNRFGKVFRLTPAKVERIFNGSDIILKSNVAEDKAMDFAVKLAEIGCETYIEVVPNETNQLEENRTTTRRIRFRRGPRPGAIVPDRRLLVSRRADDIKALASKGNFPGITVGPGSLNDDQTNEK